MGIGGGDAGEVYAGQKGNKREDNEAEIGVGGLEGFVKPLAEGVGARTRAGRGEGGGNGVVSVRGEEEGAGGAIRVSEGREEEGEGWRREDGGEGVDARAGFGDGLPP